MLHSLCFLTRSRASLHLEIVALRHQLAVVNRSRRQRLRLTSSDRMLWAWLSQRWRGWCSALHVVQPATVLALASPRLSPVLDVEEPTSHGAAGRATRCPRVDSRDVHGEPTLGRTTDPRRAPEIGNLSESVDRCQIHATLATASVADMADLPHQSCHPDHGRRSVRRADDPFRLLFVLVIFAHDRRRIVHVAVTEHPTAAWTAQQLRNVFSENETPRYLLHDRDSVFADVATTIAGMNTAAVRTAPRSPWQNAYVECVIASIDVSVSIM